MRQIALPLRSGEASRIVVGNANEAVIEAFANRQAWPFHTAILYGPPRSGKSLLADWFAESGSGSAIDDAARLDETALFHRWNSAQQEGRPLLLVGPGQAGTWQVKLPDLASRLGAALRLTIGTPDDAMLAELIAAQAEQRGLVLGEGAATYLVPRMERSHISIERLVAAIDRLSLERKQAATLAIWRDALEEVASFGKEPGLSRLP